MNMIHISPWDTAVVRFLRLTQMYCTSWEGGRGRVYNYKPVNHCLNQSSYCKIIIFFKHQCMYMWILFSSQSFETGWENYDVQNRDSNWDPLNLWSGALTTEPSGASIQTSCMDHQIPHLKLTLPWKIYLGSFPWHSNFKTCQFQALAWHPL